MLQKTLKFLQDNKTFYVATVEDGKPKVRPFGLVLEYDGKLWFGTANTKSVYKQLQANPYVEISTTSPSMVWLRLSGKAVFEANMDVKRKAFELVPMLAHIYSGPDAPEFEVFYLDDACVTYWELGNNDSVPQTHRLYC